MTSRERRTVYPLLFLAIGLAIRPGESEFEINTEVLSSSQVRCREILVESDNGTVLLHMGRVVDGGGGRIEVKDSSGENTVAIGARPGESFGRVEFFDDEGRLRSVLDGLDQ
jgi:hypothetical protein